MNLENTKIYTTDPEVIRKYAELCGVDYNHDTIPADGVYVGVSCVEECDVIERFTDASDVHAGRYETTLVTPDQINALYDEKFGNHSEVPNSSEWNGEGLPPIGIECEIKYKHASNANWRECKVFAYSNKHGTVAAVWHLDCGIWCHNTIEVSEYEFKKPETPEQREERERLEAAYDLYLDFYQDHNPCHDTIESFDCSRDKDLWLRTVDKTNYRKQKEG